jgi:hypothetical protein
MQYADIAAENPQKNAVHTRRDRYGIGPIYVHCRARKGLTSIEVWKEGAFSLLRVIYYHSLE